MELPAFGLLSFSYKRNLLLFAFSPSPKKSFSYKETFDLSPFAFHLKILSLSAKKS
jgi:hypothetical protein